MRSKRRDTKKAAKGNEKKRAQEGTSPLFSFMCPFFYSQQIFLVFLKDTNKKYEVLFFRISCWFEKLLPFYVKQGKGHVPSFARFPCKGYLVSRRDTPSIKKRAQDTTSQAYGILCAAFIPWKKRDTRKGHHSYLLFAA